MVDQGQVTNQLRDEILDHLMLSIERLMIKRRLDEIKLKHTHTDTHTHTQTHTHTHTHTHQSAPINV